MRTSVICAWCSATIRAGDTPDDESSHGICFDCVKTMGLFPTEDIHSLTREQLDCLPIGVVELDGDGIVRQYNAAEAKAAGLDVDDVLGKRFFVDVAPCASVREFHGRAMEIMKSPQAVRDAIDFLFKFRTGDRSTHIVMSWDPARQRLTLLIDLLGEPSDHSARAAAKWES